MDIDKKFDELFINENFIKKNELFPNKIKLIIEKGKLIDNKWNDNNKLNIINDCLNIENNIKYIMEINDKIIKCNSLNSEIKFIYDENDNNKLLEIIKKFGFLKNNILFDSNIEFDEKLVQTWLNNRKFKTELLYRKSKDGSTPDDFHKKCDNILLLLNKKS